jgi:WD40 repeat protein
MPLTAGDLISGSEDGLVKVWNAHTLQLEGNMAGHRASVHAIVAAGQGVAFSGSEDLTVRRWDTYTLMCTHVVMGHTSCVCALHVAGQFLYSGSWNGTVRVWSAADLQFLEVRVRACMMLTVLQTTPSSVASFHTLSRLKSSIDHSRMNGMYGNTRNIDTFV